MGLWIGYVWTQALAMEHKLSFVKSYHHNPNHLNMPAAWVLFFCLSHLSLLVIAFGKSFRGHPLFAQNRWMKVFAGRPTLVHPCVQRRTSFMRLSLLVQQCPVCLARFTWMSCLSYLDVLLVLIRCHACLIWVSCLS